MGMRATSPRGARRGASRMTSLSLLVAVSAAYEVPARLHSPLAPHRQPRAPAPLCAVSDEVAAARAGFPMRPGSLVALVTPMLPGGEIDVEALRGLLRWHAEAGTDGIVALGTTGEASTLNMEERAIVLQTCREEIVGRVPLMVGTGTIDPRGVIAMNEQALEYGADSCLVVTPYYTKPTQRGLTEFFTYVADATPKLPMLLYNVPGRTAVDLRPDTVAELAKHPSIFGIKEATGELGRVDMLRELIGPDFMLLSGEDSNANEFTLRGGDGVISYARKGPLNPHTRSTSASARG